MIELKIVAALSENRVIGNDGRRPWSQPDDITRFELLTRNHPVIIGRKRLQDLWIRYNGRPPNHRHYIVLSKSREGFGTGIDLARYFEEAVDIAEFYAEKSNTNLIYVGGGEKVFRTALAYPRTTLMELTHVNGVYPGDAYFPEVGRDWDEIHREFFDEQNYSLAIYKRAA